MVRMRKWLLLLVVMLSPALMGAQGCPTLAPEPLAPSTPLAFCSQAGLFYCNANGGPQTLQGQGWSGYCMAAGSSGNYTTGYSGYTGGGGATPVYSSTSQAWDACGSTGPTDRGVCLGVITCQRN